MMMAEAEASAALASELVSIDALGGGSPRACHGAAAASRTMRKKEIGFQVLSGSAENLCSALEAGVSGAILAFAAPAPQACQEVYTAWKENDPRIAGEKQQRLIAGFSCGGREVWHSRTEACLRPERLLRWRSADSASAAERRAEGRSRRSDGRFAQLSAPRMGQWGVPPGGADRIPNKLKGLEGNTLRVLPSAGEPGAGDPQMVARSYGRGSQRSLA